VTGISADVVDEQGVSVPITSVMLHHIVLGKLGTPDATCQQFNGYDGRAVGIPVERFYAEGEERTAAAVPGRLRLPQPRQRPLGPRLHADEHKPTARTAYVQYTVHYVTGEQLTP
jgi:hypothetical protein